MKKKLSALALTLLLGAAAQPIWAQGSVLSAPEQRISDVVIQADHQLFEATQNRIRALNERGRPVRDYHLSKAQCWLDVAFHEYTRNDRGPFPEAALQQSEALIAGMERGQSPLPMDTPLVGEAIELRPDLWARTAALKQHAGFSCAQQALACAEVELVHAGNELAQQQWRHAKPYVQIAEDLLGQAERQAKGCVMPLPAPLPTPVPMAAPAPAPVQTESVLSASVVFNFDRHGLADMRPHSRQLLQSVLDRIKAERLQVMAVVLTAHADRLNSTRQADYNLWLAGQRLQTVRAELERHGIAAQLIQGSARGDADPVQQCDQRSLTVQELRECLLPNRRVELLIRTRQAP